MKKAAIFLVPVCFIAAGIFAYQKFLAPAPPAPAPLSEIIASEIETLTPVLLEDKFIFPPPPVSGPKDPTNPNAEIDHYIDHLRKSFASRPSGKVIDKDGFDSLFIKDKKVFEAIHIPFHHVAKNGFSILSATTEVSETPFDDDPITSQTGRKIYPTKEELWLLSPNGEKQKISSESNNYRAPNISPDGRYIAFSIQSTEGPDNPYMLYIRMIKGDRKQLFISAIKGRKLTVGEWVDNSKSLIILQEGDSDDYPKFFKVRAPGY